MGLLTRDAILDAQDIETCIVPVPEWGGEVMIRALTGAERDAFENETVQRKGKDVSTNMKNIRARLVVLSIVGETGRRLFGFKDIELLGNKSAKALDRVFGRAMALSGLSAADVDELAKNSKSDQSEDSISA